MVDLSGKEILVLGAGRSGVAAARLARALHAAKTWLLDEAGGAGMLEKGRRLAAEGLVCCFGSIPSDDAFRDVDMVVFSPGISRESRLGRLAERLPAAKFGELGFGAMQCPSRMIAVTGTNGKTTTVELIRHCLRTSGVKAEACGNIGLPISEVAMTVGGQVDWLVVEVSSFQLEHPQGFAPDVGVILNVTPDHLARHGGMEEYTRLKLSLADCLKPGGTLCIQAPLAPRLHRETGGEFKGNVVTFSAYQTEAELVVENGMLGGAIPVDSLQMVGRHNCENALAALAVCRTLGLRDSCVAQAMATFRVDDHRLQKVGVFDGVAVINDSKATNVDALVKALQAVGEEFGGKEKKIVLIAGGIDKGCDLSDAKNELMIYVKEVVLIGECRESLAAKWAPYVPVRICCGGLDDAVREARRLALPGDVILLSPGCASQDMFTDYAQRGLLFSKAIAKEFGR